MRRANKDVVLSVSNNEDFTVFDMCLSVCASDEALLPSAIKIQPLLKEYIPNTPNLSGAQLVFSNKCLALFFGGFTGLHAHTTKDYFRVKIEGGNITKDLKIAFDLYDWSREPSMFSLPHSLDQFPSNFNDVLNGKTPEDKKPGATFVQKIKTPINPYFPNEKTFNLISMGVF